MQLDHSLVDLPLEVLVNDGEYLEWVIVLLEEHHRRGFVLLGEEWVVNAEVVQIVDERSRLLELLDLGLAQGLENIDLLVLALELDGLHEAQEQFLRCLPCRLRVNIDVVAIDGLLHELDCHVDLVAQHGVLSP